MNKHTAISPDGTIETRSSKTRVYKICIFGKCNQDWVVFGWSRDIVTAQRAVSSEKSAHKRYGCKFPYSEILFVDAKVG